MKVNRLVRGLVLVASLVSALSFGNDLPLSKADREALLEGTVGTVSVLSEDGKTVQLYGVDKIDDRITSGKIKEMTKEEQKSIMDEQKADAVKNGKAIGKPIALTKAEQQKYQSMEAGEGTSHWWFGWWGRCCYRWCAPIIYYPVYYGWGGCCCAW